MKKAERWYVCYYPVDGLFIHVFVTKLTGEVVHVNVTQANPAMPVPPRVLTSYIIFLTLTSRKCS